ncbi:MAG: TusE/DsrC/DsvC family sulfur relay protein [Luminiphilus sp.]|nr:TusE/DsrC/DsvC family sulfur relay protein [Luminiphilus sp.]
MAKPTLDSLCDQHGYLKDWTAWDAPLAESFAALEGITLTEPHWEILRLLRDYFACYQASPANRALVNWVKKQTGPSKGNSIYLMTLFPGSPTRVASRIAGLPKPKNCL